MWRFAAIPESGTSTTFTRSVSSIGSTGVDSQPFTINSTTIITFSRISTQGSTPLISRMIINAISEGLDGVQVECINTVASEVATTTILIIGDTPSAEIGIQSYLAQFSSDTVNIILEWTLSNSQSCYQQILRNVSVNVVPDLEVVIRHIGNMSIQLTLQYNTLYSVGVTQPGICGRPNQTAYIELRYSKCYNPVNQIADVIIEEYKDPALEGENITFSCPDGLILTGPNSSTCMGDGDWEPDPRNVTCTSNLVMTGTATSPICNNPLYVLRIRDSIIVVKQSQQSELDTTGPGMCCSGLLIITSNTSTCLENGEWELESTQMKIEGISDPANAMLRTALISITCVLVMATTLVFIIGYVCGHYCNQRCRKSETESVSNPTSVTEHVEGLELKENVAYITLRPK